MVSISYQDSLALTAAAGLAAHIAYHKLELRAIPSHLLVIFGLPIALAINLTKYESVATAALHAFGLYWAAMLASICVYRLGPMHPLAQYPGPFWLKLSKFPLAWYSYVGTKHQLIYQWHQRYGKVIRIGPNHLSFNDVTVLSDMMGRNGLPKGSFWEGFTPGLNTSSLIGNLSKDEHADRRKHWTRGFSTEAMHGYEDAIFDRTLQLLDAWEEKKGTPVDVSQWCDWYTFDNMTDMAFSGGSEMIRDGDPDNVIRTIISGRAANYLASQIPWTAPFISLMMKYIGHPALPFRNMALKAVFARLEKGSERKDLFYYLSEDGQVKITPPRAMADGTLAIIAGSDTTSTTLSNIFWLLLQYPDVYARLQKEVDQSFPGGEELNNSAVQSHMPILNAVINEALRLYPIVPSGSERIMVNNGNGGLLGNYAVATGTEVQAHTYSMQRDASNFSPAPEHFLIDRWLPEELRDPSAPKITEHNTTAFIPFSYGPSNCAGKPLAMHELRLLVTATLKRFDLKVAKGYDLDNYGKSFKDQFGAIRGALMVSFLRR